MNDDDGELVSAMLAWEDTLRHVSQRAPRGRSHNYEVTADNEERIANGFLFSVLGFEERERSPTHGARINRVMKKHGWEYSNSVRIGGTRTRGYTRPLFDDLM